MARIVAGEPRRVEFPDESQRDEPRYIGCENDTVIMELDYLRDQVAMLLPAVN